MLLPIVSQLPAPPPRALTLSVPDDGCLLVVSCELDALGEGHAGHDIDLERRRILGRHFERLQSTEPALLEKRLVPAHPPSILTAFSGAAVPAERVATERLRQAG